MFQNFLRTALKNLQTTARMRKNYHISITKTITTTSQSVKMPHTICVQLLPVMPPSRVHPKGKILLCKWKDGDFESRYTGMIKVCDNSDLNGIGPDLHTRLAKVAQSLAPSGVSNSLDSLELVAILEFDGPPITDEYVFLGKLKKESYEDISAEGKTEVCLPFDDKGVAFDDKHPCYWFDLDKIPYQEMPEDDQHWYPKVLIEGLKVRGSFVFGGLAERKLKSFVLKQVDTLETL